MIRPGLRRGIRSELLSVHVPIGRERLRLVQTEVGARIVRGHQGQRRKLLATLVSHTVADPGISTQPYSHLGYALTGRDSGRVLIARWALSAVAQSFSSRYLCR
jgi:hypothetical protein